MLFYATYEIAKEAIKKILGETPEQPFIDEISAIIKQCYSKDVIPHHFHIHNYVNHQELTFHIKVDNHLTIEKGHQIATEIETRIFKLKGIITTIHIEPLDYEHDLD